MRPTCVLAALLLAVPLLSPANPAAAADPAPTACSYVASDFNGDGHADVATGEPYRTVGGLSDAGAVRVLYGGAGGLATAHNQMFSESSFSGFPAPAASDHFGIAITSGYVNGDCYADLAIGVPGAGGGIGAVIIMYGSPSGLDAGSAQEFPAGSVDANVTGKQKFGWSLAAGDFNGDGADDLAVGADARGGFAGGTYVLYGSDANGLSTTNAQSFTESTAGIPGTATKGDEFGYALAAGDFNGDGASDLAIGVPGKELSKAKQAGMVITLSGSGAGLSASTARYWRQGLGGLGSTPEPGDSFGFALTAGSITGHAWDDLAIGSPGEGIGSAASAGTVQVVRGSSTGLTGSASQTWTQHNPAVPGDAERGDQFGWSVSMGDYNGDGHADLAIGTPYEDLGSRADAGNVTVLYGTGKGLGTGGVQTWSQDSTGIAGGAEAKDAFGYSLQSLPIASANRDDLVVGDPGEDASGFINDGALAVIRGGGSHGLTAADNQLLNPATLTGGAQNFAKMGVRLG